MATLRTSGGGKGRVVLHVDPRSVARLAFGLSLATSAVVFVGLMALFVLGAASGALEGVESFIESLGWADFQIRFFSFVPVFVLLSLLGSAVTAAAATAGAALYNALSDLLGGIEVDIREEDPPRRSGRISR